MPSRDPKRRLLYGGIGLLGVGALLFAGSFYAPALRSLVTWFALAGTVVVLLYFVVRRAATAPELDKRDATLFPQSTMMDDLDRKEKGD